MKFELRSQFFHIDVLTKTCHTVVSQSTEVYKCDDDTHLDPNKENIFTDYSVIQNKFSYRYV